MVVIIVGEIIVPLVKNYIKLAPDMRFLNRIISFTRYFLLQFLIMVGEKIKCIINQLENLLKFSAGGEGTAGFLSSADAFAG